MDRRTKVTSSILLVFTACCTNVFFLELITRFDCPVFVAVDLRTRLAFGSPMFANRDGPSLNLINGFIQREEKNAVNLITFAQMIVIAIEGFIFTTRFGTKPRNIPLKHYVILVTMFFVVSVTNNYTLSCGISMPLHMIFKSGSLIANLILGVVILKRRYKLSKYISVIMITIGIAICTIVSVPQSSTTRSRTEDVDSLTWSIGILLLTMSLFLSARMGIYQETLYTKYGKHTKETLFYCHVLPLPCVVLFWDNIASTISVFNKSDPLPLLATTLPIPKMWIYLLLNTLTQYMCINSVFTLTTECTSLTVTLVITLRKFISLIVSIFYFKNPFTIWHTFGTVLVLFGSLLFTELSFLSFSRKKKEK